MKRKKVYVAPVVLRKISLQLEGEILTGSLAGNTTIVSTGQEVQEWDYETGFEHTWGD